MKNINFVVIVLIIILSIFSGCVEEIPAGTPTLTPTASPTLTPTPAPMTPEPTPIPTLVVGLPIKYRVWIDSDFGFYRMRAIKGDYYYQLSPDFDILNFTISEGDSVRWINDDSYDFPMTIVSNEGLWTGRTGLTRYQGERFEYTFNETGTYTFSIREFSRLENQSIHVKSWSMIE